MKPRMPNTVGRLVCRRRVCCVSKPLVLRFVLCTDFHPHGQDYST